MASRSGRPGAISASWPTNSSSVRGRMRSASGRCCRRRRRRARARRRATFSQDLSLPRRFEEHQGRGDRDVERLDRRAHGNRQPFVRCRGGSVGQPGAFAAEQDGDRAAQVGLDSGVPPRGTVASSATPRAASAWRHGVERLPCADGQAERAAHRAAQRFPAEGIGRSHGADDAGAPQASAARIDRADVAGVLHAGQHQEQRRACGARQSARRGTGRTWRSPTRPEGVRTGLIAASTASATCTTRAPASLPPRAAFLPRVRPRGRPPPAARSAPPSAALRRRGGAVEQGEAPAYRNRARAPGSGGPAGSERLAMRSIWW